MADELKNPDMLALRHYITAKDASQYDSVDQSIVIVNLTHSNLQQKHIEIRFYKHDLLSTLRQRIHQKTGTPPHHQHLQIIDSGNIMVEIPPETSDDYKLGYFGILHHGLTIHCTDLDPYSGSANGGYEDTSLVEKYKMDDETYSQRSNTVRAWAKEKKQEDPTFTLRKHAENHRQLTEAKRQHKLGLPLPKGFFIDSRGEVVKEDDDEENVQPAQPSNTEYGPETVAHATVGSRCQIEPGERRGKVAWVGNIAGKGFFVGVILDEPVGQNDGSLDGVKYFDAPDKYGAIVRGYKVQVGDFPERDLWDSEDEL